MKTTGKISAIAVIAALLVTAPAAAVTLNVGGTGSGGLLHLGGSNTDPTADVLSNGTSGSGTPNGTATTNALNTGGGPTTADVLMGGTGSNGGTHGNVLLDLFGTGGGNDATAALGSGAGSNGAAIDLFGNGGSSGGGTNGNSGGANGDLFGPNGGVGGSSGTLGNGIRVASLDSNANARCFAPDATQIARLTSRHAYDGPTLSGWVKASSISVVSTRLCDGAKSTISQDGNVARLRAFVSGNLAISSALARQGRSPGDVIAIDRKGSTLVVYVS